ncbi:MAG: host attachment protein [Alphaproteobacteria bacterium]
MPVRRLTTWVLVADGGRARILRNDGVGKGLQPVAAAVFAVDNPPTRDQGSDRPGRVHDRMGTGRHAMEPKADWHRAEKVHFASSIAERLDAAAGRGDFDRLIVIAPPAALGDLRTALDDRTRRLVTGEIAKDLTNSPDSDVERQVGTILAV